MLYKGKRNGLYLYELTESDLVLRLKGHEHYSAGNVLLFANKKQVTLGSELVKADDLATALEYLEGNGSAFYAEDEHDGEYLASLKNQLAQSEANLQRRDVLLHDLTADLESQRYSNEVLISQLESLREQISIEKLTRDEVIGDLEVASAETYRKDKELQDAIDAKTQLEQELAARICELLELDSANADLQKRLEQRVQEDKSIESEDSATQQHPTLKTSETALSDGQVYTMASGKQIHVYHEFPSAKPGRRSQSANIYGILRFIGLALLAILIFLAGSVLATANLNDISLGEALDMTLKTLLP